MRQFLLSDQMRIFVITLMAIEVTQVSGLSILSDLSILSCAARISF